MTVLTVTIGNYSKSCVITISGYTEDFEVSTEPYIYSNYSSIIQLKPDETKNIFVSLFKGSAEDINGYSWSCDKTGIVELAENGQYCRLKALSEGYCRIKVTHTKAAYPYYLGIYVIADLNKVTYITTSQNIVTLNKNNGDSSIKVQLENPLTENYEHGFSWSVVENQEILQLTANAENAIITPKSSGSATIRITHPQALYPLDITVRIVDIVQNVYINPSQTKVEINGSEYKTISAELKNISQNNDYGIDDFTWEIENSDIASLISVGNECQITGLKNGSTHIYVKHPMSKHSRQILLLVTGQIADAIDSSCYITTRQNFIKTKVGAKETEVNVELKGGSELDEKNFLWTVQNESLSGTGDVISLYTADSGSVEINRAASQTFAYGTSYITPLQEGEAVITVTNPKSYYPTEILVKVLSENAVLEAPLYFSGEPIIKFLNTEEYETEISLKGNSKIPSDDSLIEWKTESSTLEIQGNGTKAILRSNTTGNTSQYLIASHPKAENDKEILVLTADTQEELDSIKAFYSSKLYYSVNKGNSVSATVDTVGFTDDFDFTSIVWTSSNPSVATVEAQSDYPLTGIIKGNSSGTAKITAKYLDIASITFTITVYPEDVVIGEVEKSKYFTTSQNVVNLGSVNSQKTVSITAVGFTSKEAINILWESEDSSIANVVGNGTKGTITALSEGETVIKVTHPDSENELKIHVRVGSEYVINENDPNNQGNGSDSGTTSTTGKTIHISTNTEIIALVKNSEAFHLTATLVNCKDSDTNSFKFSIDDSNIAEISNQFLTGSAFITPKNAGEAEITITNEKTLLNKKILVLVANTLEELQAFKYLTTSQNVVNVGSGSTKNITVSIQNAPETILDGYTYASIDNSIMQVQSFTSGTVVIKGISPGSTKLIVKNTNCSYPLEIIVNVFDPTIALENPYIEINPSTSVLNFTVGASSWTTLSATLVGGEEQDYKDFVWETTDASILSVYGQNGTGKAKALEQGMCYITVSHPKAQDPAQILCICEKVDDKEYSISLSVSNPLILKPSQGEKTITATLLNGATVDNADFSYSLDDYQSGVVDIETSGNICILTPLTTGTCNLIVSHPKAQSQKIFVKVSEYTSFGFGNTTQTITEGLSSFISMQVPATNVDTYISYRTENEKVCSIKGIDSVCQITGTGAGTCVVYADWIQTSTQEVLGTSTMLISVEKANSGITYITASQSIFTMERGTNRTLTAILTGSDVIATDQLNLCWKSSDSSIVKIRGTSTTGIATGPSVYIEADSKNSGDAIITVSHEKSNSIFTFRIIVPGDEVKNISLSKTYISFDKGSSATINAIITNASSEDYKAIEWRADKSPSGNEIVRVAGSGKQVTLYAVSAGQTTLYATFNGITETCNVEVKDQKTLIFEASSVQVTPNGVAEIKFTCTPSDASLTWIKGQTGIFSSSDPTSVNTDGSGVVKITGISEGNTTLTCLSSYGNKATVNITVNWNYNFIVATSVVEGTPDKTYTIPITKINPINATITADSCSFANINCYNKGDGTGYIEIEPKSESSREGETISLYATNPSNNEEFASKSVKLKFFYDKVTPKIKLLSTDGKYTEVLDDSIIQYGDGENSKFEIFIEEENSNAQITKVELWKSLSDPDFLIQTAEDSESSVGDNCKVITLSSVDKIPTVEECPEDYEYKINWATKPEYYPDFKYVDDYFIASIAPDSCVCNHCYIRDTNGDNKITVKEDKKGVYTCNGVRYSIEDANGLSEYYRFPDVDLYSDANAKPDFTKVIAEPDLSKNPFFVKGRWYSTEWYCEDDSCEYGCSCGCCNWDVFIRKCPSEVQIEKVTPISGGVDYGKRTVIDDWKTSLSWKWQVTVPEWFNYTNTFFGSKKVWHNSSLCYLGIISADYSDVNISDKKYDDSARGGPPTMFENHEEKDYKWLLWYDTKYMQDREEPQYGCYYKKVAAPEETGLYYSKNDFEKIAWWYCPEDYSVTGSSTKNTLNWDERVLSIKEGIMTANVDADLLNTNDSPSLCNTKYELQITVNHNNSTEIYKIPVIANIRNCAKTFQR